MKKIFDGISKTLTWISLVLLVVYTILVAVQVISRYVFHSPTTWTELVARYLFVWSIMLYMPVLYRLHGNAAFDLVLKKAPVSIRRWLSTASDLAILACGCFLARWGLTFCQKMANKRVVGLGSDVHIPMNVAYCAIPVGAALLILMCVERLVFSFRGKSEGGEEC